jgi:Transmembrane protein
MFQIVMHFFGGVFCCWFIIDVWPYTSYLAVFLICSLFPALVEASVVLGVLVCRVAEY